MEKPIGSTVEALARFTSPEEELIFLRNQIANKEKELKDKKLDVKLDHVVAEEISRYRDIPSKEVLHPKYAITKGEMEAIVLNLEPEEHDKKMEELAGRLESKGIKNTMSILSGFRDPHLEDDFHRFLVQFVKQGYDKKKINLSSREFRGVDMTLYEVVLPEDPDSFRGEGKTKSLKEVISSMEQFLAGMLSVVAKDETKTYKENYIVLEIANANDSDQFIFYVAVPNRHKELFEKQIISIFHNARLTEMTSDYNIFNAGGISVGSYVESSNNPTYQFKTYESFDYDPLNIILNSFSKIQKSGEGAGIQIIFAPKGEYYNKQYEYVIEQIEKGVPTKDAINSAQDSIGSIFLSFFKSPAKIEPDKKAIDAEAIQKIKQKIDSPIVATNIRLIASAKTKEEAERILRGMESSFNQFSNPGGNGLMTKRQEKSNLEKMFRDFSFRSFNPSKILPLNLRELTTIIHFHNTALSPTPQLKQSQAVSAPAPANIGKEGTLLGVNSYRNVETPIYMQDEDRLRHLYTIGQTGTGKSTLLKSMIVQDISRGNGVCFIDPHGSDVLDILSNIPENRFQDVIYFDPSYTERPMALNMLEYDRSHPEQKTFVVNELFSIFQKLYGKVPEALGPMFEQYFRNATMLVIEDPDTGCTLLDVSRVMTNKAFRQQKLSNCKNPIVVQFWTEVAEKAGGEASLANIVPYITSKFDVFLANDIMRPIIAQEKSSFDFRKIMDEKKILLVNLSKGRLGDINANLIGLILVGKILMAALSRVDAAGTNIPPFYLYIDEFQNITTNSIATILSEARKYKLSLNIAHQFIAQLEENIKDAVFGNVGSLAVFRVGAEDAEYLEKQFSPVFTAKDIMNIDNFNAYMKMLVGGKPVKAFNVRVSNSPKGNPEVVEKLKQLSYTTYGGDRQAIEGEILRKYKK